MSWDSYIDNLIARGHGNIDKGSIIGLNGGKWTTKMEINLSNEEAAKIGQAFTSNDFSSFQANGVMLEGQKYQFLSSQDGKVVFAKMKDLGSVTMQCSKKAVVLAHTPEGKAQGAAAVAVAAIAEYLESLDF